MVWASELAHDYNNGLFHADTFLFKFFRQHKEVVSSKYVQLV